MLNRAGLFSKILSVSLLLIPVSSFAQTREKGPWWPSPFGPTDQAGNSNYITPASVLKALKLVKTGQIYELGHIYEASMPQFGNRPYYLNVQPAGKPARAGGGSMHEDYFTGFIGQMGTQWDALGHMGETVKMADGTLQYVYYNGFTEDDLTGKNRGQGGLETLGAEQAKPILTRGILVDVAAYKGVTTLEPNYELSLADLQGALAKEKISEASLEPGDAVLFNFGWAVNWTNPSKYNDGRYGSGENKGSPGIGFDVAHWAVEHKLAMVGADTCCVMIMPQKPGGNVHHELLLHGTQILENMDLMALARDQVYEFFYINLPERIKGATGAPMRPIAIR